MRGRSSLWYRVRVNLIHVPEGERPAQEPLESDFDPWAGHGHRGLEGRDGRVARPTPGSRSKQPKPADSEAEGVSPAEHAKTDSTRPAAADNEAGYEAEGRLRRPTHPRTTISRVESAGRVAMIEIVGIDHVQLSMPPGGEEQARAFYGEVLGLREVEKPAALAGRGGCWFANDRVSIHLGGESGFGPLAKAHPALLVGDLAAARAALQRGRVADRGR